MMSISFRPLFYFGVIVGIISSAIGYGLIKLIIYLIAHLQWV